MWKLLGLGLLVLTSAGALAQGAPALDVFTSPDGAFRFSYPERYELVSGERLLKATVARNLGFPVCDFSTTLVCVIYPIEKLDNDAFEAAGFSVGVVAAVTAESECLGFSDRFARPTAEHAQPSSYSIRGRVFHHVSAERRTDGHAQSSDFYRTFQNDRCYELRIEISLSEKSPAPQQSSSKQEAADGACESLHLILSSVVFK